MKIRPLVALRTSVRQHATYRRAKRAPTQRIVITALYISGFALFWYSTVYFLGPHSGEARCLQTSAEYPTDDDDFSDLPTLVLQSRRDEIAAAFQHAWDGYARHCFGHDTLQPVTHSCADDFGGWGASAIDALSTAIIMGKEDVVLQILEFIEALDLDIVKGGFKIQVFEVVIRHFGGMISAWDLLNGPFSHLTPDYRLRQALHDKMIDLGDRLSCAFNTTSGIPHDWVDPATCETDNGVATALTGPGTAILEFSRLSAITGNDTYLELADRAERHLLQPRPATDVLFPGLLGSHVSIKDGRITDSHGSWGSFSDSFYEYLIKAYIYDSDRFSDYRDRWLVAADSTIQHIGSHPYGHPEWTLLSTWRRTRLTKEMETLAWFAGGNFILGGMVTNNQTLVDYGLSIADAAGQVYSMTTTGLGGEFVTWTTSCDADVSTRPCNESTSIMTVDGRYQLRPEVIETWYHAYRATLNPKYIEWAWSAFLAINTTCRTDSGFSSINDVNAPLGGGHSNKQESFVFAEVLKYLYLIHNEDKRLAYQVQDSRLGLKNTWVFNTEAHPLRVAGTPV